MHRFRGHPIYIKAYYPGLIKVIRLMILDKTGTYLEAEKEYNKLLGIEKEAINVFLTLSDIKLPWGKEVRGLSDY